MTEDSWQEAAGSRQKQEFRIADFEIVGPVTVPAGNGNSSVKDFMAGTKESVVRSQWSVVFWAEASTPSFRNPPEVDIRNPGERMLLDTGSRPPQADSSGMTIVTGSRVFQEHTND